MQQLMRLYVSQFGTPTAWYDHLLFDLTDPGSGLPTDVLFHLENAGGKTSLLSFLFSCFDPRKERWLQHLQNRSHRLEDYFRRDGRLAFLIMEWRIPRSPLYADTLVLGQAVSLRDNTERGAEAERCFFAFRAGQGVSLETIPAPGLAEKTESAHTMQEFMHWMQQASRTAGDMFYTKVQDDWIRHLKSDRGLDMDLLRMQVDFNSNEGGMEEGFLTFNSEWDFLHRFLELTLDPEKSLAVRANVAQTVDRQRLRPKYQLRETQLVRLQSVMLPFAEAASCYQRALEEQLQVRQEAAGVAAALRLQYELRQKDIELSRSEAAKQEERASESAAAAQKCENDALAIRQLLHERAVKNATLRQREALKRSEEGNYHLRCLEGAQARNEIAAALARINHLEAAQENAHQGLQSFRDATRRQSLQFGAGLLYAEKQCRNLQAQAKAEEKATNAEIVRLKAGKTTLAQANRKLDIEEGQLRNFIETSQRQREYLVQDQLLPSGQTDSGQALVYWRKAIEQDIARLDSLTRDKEALEEEERIRRTEAGQAEAEAAKAQAEQKHHREILAKGGALRETLRQHALLRMAVDAEEVDPDSPMLTKALEDLLEETHRALAACAIQLAQLKEDSASIEETGLAGRSADIETVVRLLRQAGIVSARAANTYIADLCPEASKARTLVLSDPARFLGVNVAKSDWKKVLELAPDLACSLSLPITVAVADLEPAAGAPERLVLGPRDDAAYNKEAARQALDTLSDCLAKLKEQRKGYEQRRTEAENARAQLAHYLSEYGAALLARSEAELSRLGAVEQTALNRQQTCRKQAEAAQEQSRLKAGEMEPLRTRIGTMKAAVIRLENFQRDYELPLVTKRTRLEEIHAQQTANAAQLKTFEEALQHAERQHLEAVKTGLRHENEARLLMEERNGLLYGETTMPEDKLEPPSQPLDCLRQAYKETLSLLETQERDRLGVLAEKLDRAREDHKKALDAYQQRYADLPETILEKLLTQDLDSAVRSQRDEVRKLDLALNIAKQELSQETFACNHFKKNLSRPVILSQAMHTQSDTELEASETNAKQEAARLVAAVEEAKQAAGKAAETAIRMEIAAAQSQNLYDTLQAVIPEEVPVTVPNLPENAKELVKTLLDRERLQRSSVNQGREKTQAAFRNLTQLASSREFSDAEPELSRDISDASFEIFCSDCSRVMELLQDRLCTVQDTLASMQPDFEKCVETLYDLTNEGINLLRRACTIAMPTTTPYVGGRKILKMRDPFPGIGGEARKEHVRHQVSELIREGEIPARGSALAARCLMAISGRRELGLQVLTMEPNEEHQYQPASALKGSKGQGAMLAMFLYMIITQLRDETKARVTRGGGPLLLDNPFAKVQSRPLVAAQQLLARQIGVQLIFFTASADANILAGFRRVIRLRKNGVNSQTGRSHIEKVSAVFTNLTPEAQFV